MKYTGQLHKMLVKHGTPIQYNLKLDHIVDMNSLIGKEISLTFEGEIQCISCQKITPKSFNQGFCYNCFISSSESSECIIRPELCRAHLGEGRDVAWEEAHHNQPHIVYLASSDTVKVGVTRNTQMPTRWIDQGASSAIVVAETPNRYLAGILEVELKNHFTDKTNWQRMLKNEITESIDLVEEKWSLEEILPEDMLTLFSENDTIYTFSYPVNNYPTKIKSVTFDKEKSIQGELAGIKGQYLIFKDQRVVNIRKHTGYIITLEH